MCGLKLRMPMADDCDHANEYIIYTKTFLCILLTSNSMVSRAI